MSTEQNTKTVQSYVAAHSGRDLDGIVALFAADAVVADPVTDPEHVGRDAIRAFFAGTHELADSIDLQITGPIRAVGEWAAVPMRAVSTLGEMKVAVDIIDVFTFGDDGLISDMRAYWDPASLTPVD